MYKNYLDLGYIIQSLEVYGKKFSEGRISNNKIMIKGFWRNGFEVFDERNFITKWILTWI